MHIRGIRPADAGSSKRVLTEVLTERGADAAVHFLGVTLSVSAAIMLVAWSAALLPASYIVPLTVYSLGLVTTFALSAAYNLSTNPAARKWLRRFDHAAIFTMIAGTYTPICLLNIGGAVGTWLLAAVWAIAGIGVFMKLFAHEACEKYSLGLYIAQGWLVLLAIKPMIDSLPVAASVLIVVGGAIYTIGILFYLWDRLPYNRALWHAFVFVAACAHYVAILLAVDMF